MIFFFLKTPTPQAPRAEAQKPRALPLPAPGAPLPAGSSQKRTNPRLGQKVQTAGHIREQRHHGMPGIPDKDKEGPPGDTESTDTMGHPDPPSALKQGQSTSSRPGRFPGH